MRDSHVLRTVCRLACVAQLVLLTLAPTVVGQSDPPSSWGSCATPPNAATEAKPLGAQPSILPLPPSADSDGSSLLETFEELGPDASLWFEHVQTLANPMFEGRAPGSRGGELTEEYLEFFFREYELEPAFGDDAEGGAGYRQPLRIDGAPLDGYATAGALTIAGRSLVPGEEFVVTANSPIEGVTAPVTFVGYGIESGPDGFNSFGDEADLTGRIALLLRVEPLNEDGSPRWGDVPGLHSSLVTKFLAVAARGAAGILLVNPPGAAVPLDQLDPLPPSTGFGCGALTRMPTAMITTEVAEHLVKTAGPADRDLMALRRLADEGDVGAINFEDEVRVTLSTDVRREVLDTANVAGVLRGRGHLKDRWIVVGAHHDHVGRGVGGVQPGNVGILHAGADDNASGVAAVLLLARRITTQYAGEPRHADLRSILFVGFAGEETGLNGSRKFAEDPPVPLDRISMMINLDMVGRLRHSMLFVQGLSTAAELPALLEPILERSDLNIVVQPGIVASDQVSFVNVGVPALYAMTGGHAELHTPRDRAATMNPRGAVRVVDLVEQVLLQLADHPSELSFLPQETGGPVLCPTLPAAGAGPAISSSCGTEAP